MLQRFISFCEKESLLPGKKKVLIAVSGGADSVVLCHLASLAGWDFAIGHCNFKLRGKESNDDERFVKYLAALYKVPFYHAVLAAGKYAKRKKISIQMAARDLRYEWLNKIAKEKKIDLIASAHHLDDSIETLFINLLRGTGVSGLKGISAKNKNIIRPLLFTGKKEILEYAVKEGLKWREDSSNSSDKYFRNKIRHQIIPSLKKLNSGFEKTLSRELSYFKDAAAIVKDYIEEKKKDLLEFKDEEVRVNIEKLKKSRYPETVLHELLRAYDFTPETTELIFKRLYTSAGKKFLSPTYRLIRDREFLILSPIKRTGMQKPLKIKRSNAKILWDNKVIDTHIIDSFQNTKETFPAGSGNFDLDKLSFPLILRPWKQGDRFKPLGMKGTKKISDFLIDSKVPLSEKENVLVLESAGKVVWVAGMRPDDRYKISGSTRSLFRIQISQQ